MMLHLCPVAILIAANLGCTFPSPSATKLSAIDKKYVLAEVEFVVKSEVGELSVFACLTKERQNRLDTRACFTRNY